MAEYSGEYGGVVKREIKNAGGKRYIAGAVLKPEDVEGWPLANRLALHRSGYIDWYGPPVAAENAAREAGKPARPTRTTKPVTPKVESDKPAATSRRRR